MEIGIIGLGRMGGNMVSRLLKKGHRVVANNRSPGPIKEKETFEYCRPLLAALAPDDGGLVHTGPEGSGHFVKMVHNGVEYGLMQAYAEGFQVMKLSKSFPGMD